MKSRSPSILRLLSRAAEAPPLDAHQLRAVLGGQERREEDRWEMLEQLRCAPRPQVLTLMTAIGDAIEDGLFSSDETIRNACAWARCTAISEDHRGWVFTVKARIALRPLPVTLVANVATSEIRQPWTTDHGPELLRAVPLLGHAARTRCISEVAGILADPRHVIRDFWDAFRFDANPDHVTTSVVAAAAGTALSWMAENCP